MLYKAVVNLQRYCFGFLVCLLVAENSFGHSCFLSIQAISGALAERKIKFKPHGNALKILPSRHSKIGELVLSIHTAAQIAGRKKPDVIYDPELLAQYPTIIGSGGYHWLSNSLYLNDRDLLSDNPLSEPNLSIALIEYRFNNDARNRTNDSLYSAEINLPGEVYIPFSYVDVLITRRLLEIAQEKNDKTEAQSLIKSFVAFFEKVRELRKVAPFSLDNEVLYQTVENELPSLVDSANF